jgi:hypothetical protein
MLGGLQEHTHPVELQPAERLYCDGETTDIERGLFFIEFGVMVSVFAMWFLCI